jgi:hypothetical protein
VVQGKSILADRHIHVYPECPVCRQGLEDIKHLLFTCKRAKEVWKKLGLENIINRALLVDRSGSVVLEFILCDLNQKSPVLGHLGLQETIAVGYWYIWWQRRLIVRGESVSTPTSAAFAINSSTANFGAAKHTAKEVCAAWEKPLKGAYKLNVDASFHMDGTGAAGAILRNCKGEAIGGMYCPLENVLSVCPLFFLIL